MLILTLYIDSFTLMSHYFKAFQCSFLTFPDSRLLLRNGNLLIHRVHTFQIREQQSSSESFGYDHTVPLHIQFLFGINFLRTAKHIYADGKPAKFLRLYGGESGVTGSCAHCILYNFLCDRAMYCLNRADASPEPSLLFNGDKGSCPAVIHFRRKSLWNLDLLVHKI